MRPLDLSQLPPRASVSRVFPGASPPAAPAVPASAEIRVGENGRIHGVDGMLDQIAGALVKHARPVLVQDLLPAVQRDARMQDRVGAAIGQSMAAELRPWLVVGVGALAIVAAVQIAQWQRGRARATRR